MTNYLKRIILIALFLLGVSLPKSYSQKTRIELNLHGHPKSGGLKVLVGMPLYKTLKKDWYYCEIPSKKFWKNQLMDTVRLLVQKSAISNYPTNLKILNKKSDSLTVNYNKEKGEITVIQNRLKVIYHLFDYNTARKGVKNIRLYSTKSDMKITDTSEWYGIGRQYVRYGTFKIKDRTYSIAIGDKTLDCYFGNGVDKIAIDTSLSRNQFANYNARCDDIVNVKYLDFEGKYYKICKIDSNGKFVEIQKVNSINLDSTIYIDTKTKDFKFLCGDSLTSIRSFCKKNKFLIVDVVSEFNPSHINDIFMLNGLQEKYADKITVLYLFEGDGESLNYLKKNYTLNFHTGILTDKIKKDLMAMGNPHRVIISADGDIIKMGNSINLKLEEFVKNL
jgi:hypothetical protein